MARALKQLLANANDSAISGDTMEAEIRFGMRADENVHRCGAQEEKPGCSDWEANAFGASSYFRDEKIGRDRQ